MHASPCARTLLVTMHADLRPPQPVRHTAHGARRTARGARSSARAARLHDCTTVCRLVPQFPEELLHVGQDEVDVGCWSASQNPTIAAWQQAEGFATPDQAYVYTANRIEAGVRLLQKRAVQWWPGLCLGVNTGNRSCGHPSGFCPCRGVVGDTPADVGLDTNTVLQLWSGQVHACVCKCVCTSAAVVGTSCKLQHTHITWEHREQS